MSINMRFVQEIAFDPFDEIKSGVEFHSGKDDRKSGKLKDFFEIEQLDSLFSVMEQRYGQQFLNDCRISWHQFPQTRFMWIRAEWVRLNNYLNRTENRAIVITGQNGIGE